MKEHEFAKGMTMGVMAGAALGMVMAPRKKTNMKKAAGKAMKTMGQVMENLLMGSGDGAALLRPPLFGKREKKRNRRPSD